MTKTPRIGIGRYKPFFRQPYWFLGIQFCRAHPWFDTVHRLRLGLGSWMWEIHWWSRVAWDDIKREQSVVPPEELSA